MQTILQSLGFNVSNLSYAPERPKSLKFLKRIIKRVLATLGNEKYSKQIYEYDHNERNKFAWDRGQLAKLFDKRYISNMFFMTQKQALKKTSSYWNKYDYVVVGSDQVWHNWSETMKELEYFYLRFVDENKRVNYAPSFGVLEIAPEFIEVNKKFLNCFKKLSCREKDGCELIKNLTGREALHVLDPSMLLTSEDYMKIARKPNFEVPQHYALSYVLGGIIDTHKSLLENVQKNLPIIDIYNDFENLERYLTGPEEFVWLIAHADLILTDSFHGNAFSINFKKNFVSLICPNDKSHRIESLLSSFCLSNRIYNNDGKIPEGEIDYDSVYEKLNAMREISLNYLKDCLNV